jgi:hypothetical protein
MRFRLLVMSLVVFALLAGTGFSQTFSGTIDGYWSYNFNKPRVGPDLERTNDFRAFDFRDQTFSLNYAELAIDYKPNNVGVRVDIGIGDTADVVHGAEPAGKDLWRHVQQAYVTMSKDKLTLDFGKFVTPIGAEVIETKDNWNYSRGVLFTWAIPFYHFGARATYAATDKVTLAGYAVNGWNNVKDNNTAKSFGFVGTFKPQEKWTLVTNFLVGKENPNTDDARQLFDAILSYNHNDDLAFMANYDYGRDKGDELIPGVSGPRVTWQGIAGYARVKLHDKFTLAPRYEWYQDRNGFTTGTAQEMQSFTLTGRVPWDEAMFYIEYRRDWSDADVFNTASEGLFGPTLGIRSYQNTFLLGLTYSFTK